MADLEKPPGYDDFKNSMDTVPQGGFAKPAGYDELKNEALKEEKYGTLPQQLKTAAEGAGAAATFGLSTKLETLAGVDPKDIEARREINPVSHGVGQVGGLLASSFIPGGGAAKVLEKVGHAFIPHALETFAAKAAAEAGIAAVAKATLAKATIGAVKGAAEGALFQAGDEASKMFSSQHQDPGEAAQTAIANIGMGALLGGGIGGMFGGAGALWEATVGKRISAALEASNEAINTGGPMAPETAGSQLDELISGVKSQTTPKETLESAQRLGIELPAGSSGDRTVRNLSQALSERPTLSGMIIRREYEAVNDALEKNVKEMLRDSTIKTEAQVGREIKEGIKSKFEESFKPIKESYEELKPHFQNMELSESAKASAVKPLVEHELVKVAPEGPGAKLANSISKEISGLKNVNDVKTYRTLINKRLSDAYRAGNTEIAPVLQSAKDSLTALREQGITEATKATGVGAEAKSISDDIVNKIRETDSAYKLVKDKLKSMGVEAGIGNVNDVRSLIDRFAKLSDESFATKVFDLNDINQLKYFQEHFPKEFELARRYKLRDIAEKSVSEAQGRRGKLDSGKFLSQTSDKKLNQEARDLLFGGQSQKLQDMRNVYQEIPGVVNPSGTGRFLSYGKLFSPEGVIENLSDAAKYAVLKSLPHINEAIEAAGGSEAAKIVGKKILSNTEKAVDSAAFKHMIHFTTHAISGEHNIEKGAEAIFKAGKTVLPSHLIPSEKQRKKLDKKLKELHSNMEPLIDVGGRVAHYMPDHGSAMAQTVASSVNYLNSIRPSEEKQSPLDAAPVVNKAAQYAFDRALDIANQPLIVLQSIKDGDITPQDIKHLQIMFPSLYSMASSKIMHHMMETVNKEKPIPYQTRLGLSMFLARPLDSTMSPLGISSAQPQMPQPQQGPQPSATSMKSLGKMAKASLTPLQARQASVTAKV